MTYFYRLRIRAPDDLSDALVLTSVPGGANPLISEPPTGDGQGFDPRTGATEVGAYNFRIADNGSGANAITGFLSDGNGRYDKLGRRAYGEYGTDGTTFPNLLVAGYITGVSFPSAAEAMVSVGEAQRTERNRQAFVTAGATSLGVGTVAATAGAATFSVSQAGVVVNGSLITVGGTPYTVSAFNGTTTCTLSGAPTFSAAAFSATANSFPATTMLGGGPVRWPAGVVTPVNWPNRGMWTVKRYDAPTGRGTTRMQFVSGYVLKSDSDSDLTLATNGAFPQYMEGRINTLLSTEVPGKAYTLLSGPPSNISGTGYVMGNAYADVYSGGVFVGTFSLVSELTSGVVTNSNYSFPAIVVGLFQLEWASTDPQGTQYQVYLYTRTVSENSPLHVLMHPVPIITGLMDSVSEPWDATTAAAITASIGADVRLFLRITSSQSIDTFIALLLALFGVGRRINSANKWEFFDARAKSTSAPGVTIAQDDLREIPSELWNLADSTILNNVTVMAKRFAVWAPGQNSSRPPDGLVPVDQKRTARFQLADGTYPETTQGIKEQSYDLPGTILNANGAEVDLQAFTAALAAPAFDRWGGGAPAGVLQCRDTVTAKVGDEMLLNLPFLPNASVRGGQRIVQIVQRTNVPGGCDLAHEDAGLSSQPSLAPTFTIGASAGNAATQADIALTNAAALAAAGVVSVVFEWAVSALTPTVAGQDLGSIIPINPVTLTTPGAAGGSKIWARAKSIQPGKRSGTFTSWAGVTLTAVGAVTGLAFAANGVDGSQGTLSWAAGANAATYAVRVLLRLTALSAANDLAVVDLKAGSLNAPLSNLTPSTSYTATVQYLDAQTGIVAASATLVFTSGAVLLALTAPTSPVGVVGSTDRFGIGLVLGAYGLDVTATQIPGTVEFWEALEVASFPGTFGPPVLVFTTASVNGDVTSYRARAPHDGLRRRLTARHVATGATASPFTSAQIVAPWGASQPPGYVAPALTVYDWSDSPTARSFVWTRNANTHAVWVYDTLVAVGGGSGWPVAGQLPNTILTSGTDSYVASIPPAGFQRFVQMEPRTDKGVVGAIRRSVVDATPIGLTYNQVITTISATSPTTITVTVTATAPLGSPTVQLDSVTGSASLASGPAIGVPSPSGTVWVFNRGAALGGSGQVIFRAIAAGNVDDTKAVEIPEQGRDTVYLASRARVTATSPTTVTVRFAVADPYPGASVTVSYQDQGSGGVTPATGGTITPAATLTEAAGTFIDYVITRPAFSVGTARVTFTATATGRVTDSDAVDVPGQDRDTVALTARARVTATAPTTITVRVAVADAYPQGANSATIGYLDQGSGGVTPATGSTVTPAATLTEAAGTFVDYTVTRPAFGAGAGRVTFTVTAANRTSISDALDVPEVGRDTVPLAARARVTATTPTTLTVRVAVADPFPQGAASGTVTYQDQGSGGVTPSSGGTVTPDVTLSEIAGSFIDYTITRPAFGVGAGRVTFTAAASARVSGTDAVDVPEIGRDTIALALRARVTATSATTVTVRVALADPFPQGAASGTITYQDQGSGGVTPASGGTVTPAATLTEAAGTFIDYTITRPAFAVGTARVTFTGTAASRTSGTDAVDVPALDRDTVQITLKADVIASTLTTIDVQLTANDPLGGTPAISVLSSGTPAITTASLGSNQWRLTRPAWNTASGRVLFQAVLAGRTTAIEGVTVPPQTSQSTSKILTVPAGAFQPADTTCLFNNFGWVLTASKSGGIPANTLTLSAYLPLPQGATITAIDMYSQCDSNGGTTTVQNILALAKVVSGAVPTGTTTVTNATRTAVNGDAGGLDSSATISELVAAMYMLQLVISGQTNHRFFSARVYYTQPDLSVST